MILDTCGLLWLAVDGKRLSRLTLKEISEAPAVFVSVHDDPCDRFIIATAKLNNLTVVTTDERFAEYGVEVLN